MNAVAEKLFAEAERGFEEFRSMARDRLDECLEKLKPLFEKEEATSLQEIGDALQEVKQDLSGSLVEALAQYLNPELMEQAVCPCPRCGTKVKKLRDASRKVETRHGESLLTRPYYYCRNCGESFCPMDEALELSARRKQHDLQQLALEFLSNMPFEEAAALFFKSTGVRFSDHCMHELFASFAEDIGPERVIASANDMAQRIEEGSVSGERRPVLVVAMDGAHMPLRPAPGRDTKRGPGQYKEAKGFRIYLNAGERIIHLASWHQIGDKEEITKALELAAARIPTEKVRIGLIGDGAHWLWEVMEKAFPSGRQILDYYHVSEYIHALANAQYGDNPNRALHWVESTMARLCFRNGARHVVAGLRRMEPRNKEAEEQILKTIQYLERNKRRIHYRGDRIGGYPIGSGGIESANKFICHTRLKRSGAWWLKINSNKMLALRCAIVNETFEQIFSAYASQKRAQCFCTNG